MGTARPHSHRTSLAGGLALVAAVAAAGITFITPAAAAPASATCADQLGELPDAPADASVLEADLDGDGSDERVLLYPSPDTPGAWALVTTTGSESRILVQHELPAFGDQPTVRLVDPIDLDGDGRDEVIVAAPVGAYAEYLQVWRVNGCEWQPLTSSATGKPFEFHSHGGVRQAAGARCHRDAEGTRVTTHNFTLTDDNSQAEVTITAYALGDDFSLSQTGSDETVVSRDEAFQRFGGGLRCVDGDEAPKPDPDSTKPGPTKPGATKPTPVKAKPRFTG